MLLLPFDQHVVTQRLCCDVQGRCEEEARAGQRERERADKAEEALCDIQRQLRRAPKDNADQVTFALPFFPEMHSCS